VGELLGDRPDDFDVDRLGQPGQLFERIGGGPGLSGALDGDEQGVLGGTVGRKWDASDGSLLGMASSMDRTEKCTCCEERGGSRTSG
jgi:hypothetical protein